jgi:hypothetical protein
MVRRKRLLLPILLSLTLVLSSCNAATIQAYINLAVQIALQIAQLAGAPSSLAQKVAGDLATANKLIADYKAADATAKPGLANQIDVYLTVAQTDLQNIFTSVNIVDPKLQGVIRASLAIGITVVESIRTIALANAPAPIVKAAKRTASVMPFPSVLVPKGKSLTPAQLKDLYNKTVANYPTAQLK